MQALQDAVGKELFEHLTLVKKIANTENFQGSSHHFVDRTRAILINKRKGLWVFINHRFQVT